MKMYTWKKPLTREERREILFEVEDRGDRVLVSSSYTMNMPIPSTAVYRKSDLLQM